jgi:hypothetical protein
MAESGVNLPPRGQMAASEFKERTVARLAGLTRYLVIAPLAYFAKSVLLHKDASAFRRLDCASIGGADYR